MTEEFEALEREWAQAIADHDVDTARRLLAEDFCLSSAIWRDRESHLRDKARDSPWFSRRHTFGTKV